MSVGRLLARQGRFDEAWDIQRRISQMPKFTAFESLREDAAGGLAADIYYHQGARQKAPKVLRYFYEGIVNDFAPPDRLFLATSYERLGRIHEAAGRTREAIYYYDRFVKDWVDANSALVPEREAVQRHLDALRVTASQ